MADILLWSTHLSVLAWPCISEGHERQLKQKKALPGGGLQTMFQVEVFVQGMFSALKQESFTHR